jgi:hypothetical protein
MTYIGMGHGTFLLNIARAFLKGRKRRLDPIYQDIAVDLEFGIGPTVGKHIQEGGLPASRRTHDSQYLS